MADIEVKPEHAADPTTRRVGILVGLVGILLSVVTISSHRAHTQAVILRTESNDLWAYHQAKKIRENTDDAAASIVEALAADGAQAGAAVRKLQGARDKQAQDAERLKKEAESKEAEQRIEENRALRFDIGEGLLELGLVLCSLYFLARRGFFPVLGIVAAIVGTALGIWGWLL
jgi:hypothetical protein